MKTIYLIACLTFIFTSCKNEASQEKEAELSKTTVGIETEKKELTEADKIAIASGFGNWDAVSQIDFTFNVDRQGQNVAKRSWSWKPKTDDVTMTLGDQVISYNRASLDSIPPGTDEGFINDKFWLLAPYQLVWDEGTNISVQDTATAPISQKKTKKLTIVYGNEGGYTPGDAYDFYYDADDYIIDEWVFRKSNAPEPFMMTTFSDYQRFGGLHISKSHTDKQGDLKIYFTDIKVVK